MSLSMRSIVTPIGILGAVAEHGRLCYLLHCIENAKLLNAMRDLGMPIDSHDEEDENHDVLRLIEYQVMAWFNGNLREFNVPLNVSGTLFQKRIWQQIKQIPYGETLSYRDLSARAGHPQAVRAAGTACGANPLPLIIPCHRVTRSDGALGDFAWGAEAKQHLLYLEKAKVPQGQGIAERTRVF